MTSISFYVKFFTHLFSYGLAVKKNKGMISNQKRSVFLTKKQFWEAVKLYDILVYGEKDIHFKNFYCKMSKLVIQKKYKIAKFK